MRLKAYAENYRLNNLEKEKERQRESKKGSREKNREAYNAYMREWTRKNKDVINARKRELRRLNPERARLDNERRKAHYASNPDRHRDERLKSVYGISLNEYREMYVSQEGKCAICGTHRPDKGKEGLVVDHCHSQGHIRKLLCVNCNTGIGQFRDDVQLLAKATDYLKLTNPKG